MPPAGAARWKPGALTHCRASRARRPALGRPALPFPPDGPPGPPCLPPFARSGGPVVAALLPSLFRGGLKGGHVRLSSLAGRAGPGRRSRVLRSPVRLAGPRLPLFSVCGVVWAHPAPGGLAPRGAGPGPLRRAGRPPSCGSPRPSWESVGPFAGPPPPPCACAAQGRQFFVLSGFCCCRPGRLGAPRPPSMRRRRACVRAWPVRCRMAGGRPPRTPWALRAALKGPVCPGVPPCAPVRAGALPDAAASAPQPTKKALRGSTPEGASWKKL